MKPIACLLILVLALPAPAQHRETQTVEVIEVPVYVTGAAGSVTGLTRDNFELLINGKPQAIDYFDVVDFGAIAAEEQQITAAPRDIRQRRLYLLLFDLLFSTPNSIRRAKAAAEKLLQNAGETDEFGVAIWFNGGVEIIVPFTRDRMTTRRAIRSLRTSAIADTLRLGMANEEIAALQQATADGRTGQSADDQSVCGPGSVCGDLLADRARAVISGQVEAITALAPRLRTLEGQKHVVLLSNGFSSDNVTGVASRPRSVDVQRMEATSNTAKMVLRSGAPAADPRAIEQLERLHAAFGAAGVFLDAVDTMGLRPDGIFEEKESLVMMARETGGDVIENDNDLSHALQVLTDRQRVVYILGFHAHGTRLKENAITVRLRGVLGHPDVRYRHTFSSIAETPKQVDAIRLADILINDIPQHGIEVLAEANGGNVDVRIPLAPLVAQFEKKTGLDVLMYVFSGDRVVATKEKHIGIDHDRAAAARRNSAIHFAQQFDLAPGTYIAKVIVTMDGTASAGFARREFTVP